MTVDYAVSFYLTPISTFRMLKVACFLCIELSLQVLKLLRGEMEDFQNSEQLESICDDGYNMPSYGEKNIHSHLMLAMVGLDDDAATQISTDHSVNLARSYKFLLYLCGRYSQACRFG